MCNEVYDPKYVVHDSLPEVKNDLINARKTVKMLGIPVENTIELKDATHDELSNAWSKLKDEIFTLARPMSGKTGILGPNSDLLSSGLEWDSIKKFVMDL